MAPAGGILPARGLRLHLAGIPRRRHRRHVKRRHDFASVSTPATSPSKERLTMDSDNNPEFSGYIHAIARRKALLFGVAIPIAVRHIAVDRLARRVHVVGTR